MLRRAHTAVGLIACLLASAPTAVSAEPRRSSQAGKDPLVRQAEIQDALRTLRDEVSEASQEETALQDRLDRVQERRRELDTRLAELDRKVAVVGQEARAAERALELVQSDFVRAQIQLVLEKEALGVEHDKSGPEQWPPTSPTPRPTPPS